MKQNIINKVEEITCTNYDIDKIEDDRIISMLEDLISEINRLNKKLENIDSDIRDNYRPLTNKELYGNYEEW